MNNDIHNYDDIINMKHHVSKNHPRMNQLERAAQFAPFAALKGYDKAINETTRITYKKKELSEDSKEIIRLKLNYLNNHLNENNEVIVDYFIKDKTKDGGTYSQIKGVIKKIDDVKQKIYFVDKKIININDIVNIYIPLLDKFMFD